MFNNILLTVVVYNKVFTDINIVSAILYNETNIDVFIYDNSDDEVFISKNKENSSLVHYVHDKSNPGVSTAYNKAFQYAKENNKTAVLLLDQDTYFDHDWLSCYINKYNEYGEGYIYAPIITDADAKKVYSPSYMKSFIGKVSSTHDFNYCETYSLVDKSVINSGLLIPLHIFDRVGSYNERIKLDFSDIYFIEKYKEINKNIILIDLYMKHSLSGDEGANFIAEMKRFPYYCNGAVELSTSLNKSTLLTILRRTARLVIKYRSIIPFLLFYKYYIKRDEL